MSFCCFVFNTFLPFLYFKTEKKNITIGNTDYALILSQALIYAYLSSVINYMLFV